jgi:hypothetical protein
MATTKMHLEFVGPDDLTEDLAQAITKRVQELFGSSNYSGIESHSLSVTHDRVLTLPEPDQADKAPQGELRHAVRRAIANPRIHDLLEQNGLYWLTQLAQFTESELLHIDQFGPGKLNPTRAAMHAAGLDFLIKSIPLHERSYDIIPVCMLNNLDILKFSSYLEVSAMIVVSPQLMVGDLVKWQEQDVVAHLDDFTFLTPEIVSGKEIIMGFIRTVRAMLQLAV